MRQIVFLLIFLSLVVFLQQNAAAVAVPTTHLNINGKSVPITEFVLSGPDVGCVTPHYHAAVGGFVTATDATIIPDPDPPGCGFGLPGVILEQVIFSAPTVLASPDIAAIQTVIVNPGGTLTFGGTSTCASGGTLIFNGPFTVDAGGTFTNNCPFTVGSTGSFTDSGTLINNSIITGNAPFTVPLGGTLTNTGSVTTNGALDIFGTATNSGTFLTNGPTTIGGGGLFTNTGTLTINGPFTVDIGGTLTTTGTTLEGCAGVPTILGTLTGTITDGCVNTGGGGSDGDVEPPSFSSSLPGNMDPFTINGQGIDLSSYTTIISPQVIPPCAPLSVQMMLSDNAGQNSIQHVALFFATDDFIDWSNPTYIAFDRNKPPEISDLNNIFFNPTVETTINNNVLQVNFDWEFMPMMEDETVDMLIRIWDDRRNAAQWRLPNAIELSELTDLDLDLEAEGDFELEGDTDVVGPFDIPDVPQCGTENIPDGAAVEDGLPLPEIPKTVEKPPTEIPKTVSKDDAEEDDSSEDDDSGDWTDVEPIEGICGPDITRVFTDNLNNIANRVKNLPSGETGPIDGLTFLNNNGLNTDFFVKPLKNKQEQNVCPSAGCEDTVTMCKKCVMSHIPGDITFGFLADKVGVMPGAARMGGHYVERLKPAEMRGVFDASSSQMAYELGDIAADSMGEDGKLSEEEFCNAFNNPGFQAKIFGIGNTMDDILKEDPKKQFCTRCPFECPAENVIGDGGFGGRPWKLSDGTTVNPPPPSSPSSTPPPTTPPADIAPVTGSSRTR